MPWFQHVKEFSVPVINDCETCNDRDPPAAKFANRGRQKVRFRTAALKAHGRPGGVVYGPTVPAESSGRICKGNGHSQENGAKYHAWRDMADLGLVCGLAPASGRPSIRSHLEFTHQHYVAPSL